MRISFVTGLLVGFLCALPTLASETKSPFSDLRLLKSKIKEFVGFPYDCTVTDRQPKLLISCRREASRTLPAATFTIYVSTTLVQLDFAQHLGGTVTERQLVASDMIDKTSEFFAIFHVDDSLTQCLGRTLGKNVAFGNLKCELKGTMLRVTLTSFKDKPFFR